MRAVGVGQQAWVVIIIRKCKLVLDLIRRVLEGRAVGGGDVADLVRGRGRGGGGGGGEATKGGHDVTSHACYHRNRIYILKENVRLMKH